MTSASNTPAITGNKNTSQRKFPTILLIIFFLFSVGITISGYYYFKSQEGQLVRLAENNLTAIADLKARQITNWRNERMGDANILFESSLTSERLTRFMKNPSDAGGREELLKWLESRRRNYNYENIWFFSAKGVPMLWTGENVEKRSSAFSDLFDSAARSKKVVFSDLRVIPGQNQSIMELFCPVFERTKSTLAGIMILRIDPRLFLFPLLQEWPVPSRTSKCFLAEIEGDSIFFLSEPGYEKNILTYKRPLTTLELPAVRAPRGFEPIIRETDQRGIPVFVAIRKIPDCPWLVAARTNEDEIYEPLQESKWQISTIVTILILGAAGAIGLYWQKNSTEFYRRQYELESERKAIATHFEYLTKYANDIIILSDERDHIVIANERAVSAYGYSQEELIGMSIRNLRTAEEQAKFDKDNQETAILTGAIYRTIHRRKDGSTFPVEISSRSIEIDDKKFRQGIIRDITERNQAEEQLRESEKQLSEAQHIAHMGSSHWDLKTDTTVWSEEMYRITGWDPALPGPTNEERAKLYTPESYAILRLAVARAMEKGDPYDLELDIVRRDGEVRHVLMMGRAVYDEQKRISGLAGTMQDITERKRAEDKIKEHEAQYQELVETARDAIYTVSSEATFTTINRAFESVTGWKREEWLGKPFIEALHPDDQKRLIERFSLSMTGQSQPLDEVRLRTKTGSYILVELSTVPQTRNGKVIGVLGIGRDVTERKQLEEQLRRTQRLDSIGSLASGIAHDLNNVLGPVLLGVDVLLRKSPDDSMKKVLQTMRTSSKRGSEIVKQVLAFARGTEQERSPQQLRYVINEMQSFVGQTFPKEIELKIDVPKDLPSILGDSTQLHQILLNLCVNARDAMPSGGRIQISASKVELGISDLKGHPGLAPGGYVRLSVSDSGTGIPEEIRTKIFDPFFTTKEVGKGTGLGLSTVNSIVRDNKGFLNLISEVGRGAEFQIFFPAVEQRGLAPEWEEEKEVPRGNGEGVLVVDDELSVVSLVKETLEAYNYKVHTATDGVEATVLFNRQPRGSIAVVVSDINMPRMSGVDLVKILQNSDPKLKVLITSGSPAQKEARRAELEMYRFMPKPFSADQLLRAIDNLLHETGGVLPHG